MNIFFCVDSSIQIGTGHLMRCLTLADALREKKATVSFICRELPGNLCDFIEKRGFKAYRLPFTTVQYNNNDQNSGYKQWLGVSWGWKEDAEQTKAILAKEECVINWLIIDHYVLDKQWETLIRPYVGKIMVIDDLANRGHDCNILLDQNYNKNGSRYNALVPEDCIQLLGPEYALLRPQFREARENLKREKNEVKRVLVFMGGADPTNETGKVLKAVKLLNRDDVAIDVIIGASNPFKNEIEILAKRMPNTACYFQVENMAELMAYADLCLGASGSTSWERCCLGLPSIVMILADNQKDIAEELEKEGVVVNMGWHRDVTEKDIEEAIDTLLNNPGRMKAMSFKSMELVDGQGTKRIVNELMSHAVAP